MGKKSIVFTLTLILGFVIWKYMPNHIARKNIKLAPGTKIDKLLVEKSDRVMYAYFEDSLLKSYPISLGFNPEGHKQFEGDGKTPEGVYTINDRNPNSGYYLNLGISYPNADDKEFAAAQGKSAGGDIKIHGLPNNKPNVGKAHLLKDWTHGCIAVTNEEMDELFHMVVDGAEIEIKP